MKVGVILERKEELLELFKNADEGLKTLITPIINDVVFLEGQLNYLRSLPFIKISEKNPALQKSTPASKMYKEFLQQYNNCLKTLTNLIQVKENEDDDKLVEAIEMIRKRYEES